MSSKEIVMTSLSELNKIRPPVGATATPPAGGAGASEPDQPYNPTKMLNMILSEGRKREQLMKDVLKSLEDVRDIEDEQWEMLDSMRASIDAIGEILSNFVNGNSPSKIDEPAPAKPKPTYKRYSDHLLSLCKPGAILTPYELQPLINEYLTSHGASVTDVTNVCQTMNRMADDGRLVKLGVNVFKLPEKETTNEA